MLSLPESGHLLKLLLSALHGQVFSFIQAVLKVFHRHLQVLLHPLQHSWPLEQLLLFHSEAELHPPRASSWCLEDLCSATDNKRKGV
uniref:Si:ch211-158m24.12 n=1 Tax=Amphilophus citrinellus TaxID=61819 RepID=A0A3Q0QZZ9_AMPCI